MAQDIFDQIATAKGDVFDQLAPEPIAPAILANRQAAAKTAFEANRPSLLGGLASEAGRNAGKLKDAIMNTAPGADTGMDSPAVKFAAAASPGGAATEGLSLAKAAKQSPLANLIKKGLSYLPSEAGAGAKFQQLSQAVGDQPIPTGKLEPIVSRAAEMTEHGFGATPPPLAKYIANQEPMTYDIGRDFAQSAGRLSAQERMNLHPGMKRQLSMFAQALKEANRAPAEEAGLGGLYDSALKEYRQAKTIQEALAVAKKYAPYVAAAGATGTGATYLGRKVLRDISGR